MGRSLIPSKSPPLHLPPFFVRSGHLHPSPLKVPSLNSPTHLLSPQKLKVSSNYESWKFDPSDIAPNYSDYQPRFSVPIFSSPGCPPAQNYDAQRTTRDRLPKYLCLEFIAGEQTHKEQDLFHSFYVQGLLCPCSGQYRQR